MFVSIVVVATTAEVRITGTTKRQPKKSVGNTKMTSIESNIIPFVSTIGFGGIAGFLIGFALKRIMKILTVIAGVFFAALLYVESQGIMNIHWDKLQPISNSILSTITATTNVTSTTTWRSGVNSSYFRQ